MKNEIIGENPTHRPRSSAGRKDELSCPHCGKVVEKYRNPFPTVDIVIELDKHGIVLIKRKNPPFGWAIPGGYVDYGESFEDAAIREAYEETDLRVKLKRQFHVYSDPARDPRGHTVSLVFIASASGIPKAKDDATDIGVFYRDNLPYPIAFDHETILNDYFNGKY